MKLDFHTALKTFLAMLILPALSPNNIVSAAQPVNDQDNYQGDRVTFPVKLLKAKNAAGEEACLPANIGLRGLGPATGGQNFIVIETKVDYSQSGCPADTKLFKNSDFVWVSTEDIKEYAPNRYGLTYGALVVPFKKQLSGNKDFTSNSASVGPYIGYRWSKGTLGVALELVGYAGLTSISVPQNVNGQNTSQSLSAISYGVGLIGIIKQNFQVGVVIGADHTNANSGYQYNGKPWLSFSLGYNFSN